jgi:hypothetical protein
LTLVRINESRVLLDQEVEDAISRLAKAVKVIVHVYSDILIVGYSIASCIVKKYVT